MRISDWSSDVCSSDLPKIDLVVVSHNHYDHMDLPTLKRLWARDRPLIVTSLGNDSIISQTGAKAVALDWGQSVDVRPRSEEHTSELQSLMRISYAVFCLKKKKINI